MVQEHHGDGDRSEALDIWAVTAQFVGLPRNGHHNVSSQLPVTVMQCLSR
jgi:hypothetical protein